MASWFLDHLWFRAWASYQIRKIAGCACAGNAGNVFPRRRFQRKPIVSDPGMHHGTCVTHVPWCMSGSLTCGDGENVPGIPGACAPAILRIWQEAHGWSANQQQAHTCTMDDQSPPRHPGHSRIKRQWTCNGFQPSIQYLLIFHPSFNDLMARNVRSPSPFAVDIVLQ